MPCHRVIAADGSLSNFIPESSDCTSFDFPPLTDITAKDVCYDNTDCDGPNVRTVQEALDYLCRQRNLKWHNKHLHGMGVVCGLKVQCAPAVIEDDGTVLPQHRVTVTPGYALGCEGDDLVLDVPENVDVIEAIKKLEQENGTPLFDAEGNATVCIYIDLGEAGGEPPEAQREQRRRHPVAHRHLQAGCMRTDWGLSLRLTGCW